MSEFDVYLISIVDNFINLFDISAGLSLIAVVISVAAYFVTDTNKSQEYEEMRKRKFLFKKFGYLSQEYEEMRKREILFKICIPSVFVFMLSVSAKTLTPSSKAIAAMMIIPAASQNKDLQELFGDGLDILKLELGNWKEDLKDGKQL